MNDLDFRFENIHCAYPELRFLNVPPDTVQNF